MEEGRETRDEGMKDERRRTRDEGRRETEHEEKITEQELLKRTRITVEAILFSAGRPLSLSELENETGLDKRLISKVLKRLIREYRRRDTALEVAKVGRKYTMQLKPIHVEKARGVAELEIPLKLLKTVALIAYHQPITQHKLKLMIGSKVYDHVKELHSLGLIHRKPYENTKMLRTTHRFPEYFGIDSVNKDKIKRWLAEKAGVDIENEWF